MTTNQTIKDLVNQKFDPISQKIDNLQIPNKSIEKINEEFLNDIKLKFNKCYVQLDYILKEYEKFATDKLSHEENIMFSNYLVNLTYKASKIIHSNKEILLTFGFDFENDEYYNTYGITQFPFDISMKTLIASVELMKSDNFHDKRIGIDNFIGLSHYNSHLILDILSINNRIYFEWLYEADKQEKGFSKIKIETFHEISNIFDKYRNDGIDKINLYLNKLRNE